MRAYVAIAILVVCTLASVIIYRFVDGLEEGFQQEAARTVERPSATVPAAKPEVAQDSRIPTFDIVRVDPTGEAVLAGRSQPGATVALYANGEKLAEAVADDNGEWTMLIETPLEEGTQELTLTATLTDGSEVKSEQRVVVAVPDRPDAKPLVVLSQEGVASRVLQAPEENGVQSGTLIIETVDYGEEGNVVLGGRGQAGAKIRAYLDNKFIGEATVDEKGRWSLTPEGAIAPGRYAMRVDQLQNDKVSERVELPFERAAPDDLVFSDGRVVVQPGNNLWRIARHVYGSGFQYTVIYEANKSQIRDPDLIYPGQIFEMPGDEAQQD